TLVPPSATPPPARSPLLPPSSASPAPSATPDPLLHPFTTGAATGGLAAFAAGPADGMAPDALEPDDTFEQARPLNLGAVHQHLNLVPVMPGTPDADFYSVQTKPGTC